MTLVRPSNETIKAILLCAVYAFIVLFLLSPDSYIRDVYGRDDSAWFFTCGKAWMNGMVPYVDFADSKGPLLWLIFGIGYLISHCSYIGVFWMSVISYTALLFFAYRLCRLYLDERASAVVTAIMPLILFFQRYHYETRAEDFCNAFLMLALLCVCIVLRDWKRLCGRRCFILSAAMGAACACCVMIKWNIGAAMLMLLAIALFYSIRAGFGLRSLCGMLSGFLVIVVPFVIYLLSCGAFDDFIHEYFINTTLTTVHDGSKLLPISLLSTCLDSGMKRFALLLCGILLFSWREGKIYLWLVLSFIIFWLAIFGIIRHNYYICIFLPFTIFLVLPVIDIFFNKVGKAKRFTPALCVIAALISVGVNIGRVNEKTTWTKGWHQGCDRACYIMAQVEKPKIFYSGHDRGIGVLVDALPACKYWALQNWSTDEMIAEREEALKSGVADFVIVCAESSKREIQAAYELVKKIEAAGYVLYLSTSCDPIPRVFMLYGHPGLNLPPDGLYEAT